MKPGVKGLIEAGLPTEYSLGFLSKMDHRTEVYKRLRRNFRRMIADMGDPADLSHVKKALIERFVFLEACLQTWEVMIATDPKGTETLLPRWIQGMNSLIGLAKTLGLEVKRSKTITLKSYLTKNSA